MGEVVAGAAKKFINLEAVALAFLLPLFFLPTTLEFYEFNKLALLVVALVLGYLAWGIKIAASGKIGLRRSPFNIPVLFFWLATLVSTIFSEHLVTSIAGHYGRWHPSLVTVTIFTLLYYLLVSNLEPSTPQHIGCALLSSAMVSVFLFLPQYFGRNFLDQTWSNQRSFTPPRLTNSVGDIPWDCCLPCPS